MFSLGNKEVIVNVAAQFPLTPSTATTGAVLNIKGLGTFDPTTVQSATARRYSAAQLEKMTITCLAASAMGIASTAVNVPVSFRVKVYSLRHASETSIDFIKQGRPLVLEILVQGTDDATAVATSVDAAITAYLAKFPITALPFTSAASTAYVTLTATDGFYSFGESTVTFTVARNPIPYIAATTKKFDTGLTVNDGSIAGGDTTIILSDITNLTVGDDIQFLATSTVDHKITEIVTSTKTVTFTPALVANSDAVTGQAVWKTQKAVEVINDGKYLEENVRMATQYTSDTYAINPGQVPIIGATYTMIQWTCLKSSTVGGWEDHAVPGADAKQITPEVYTMYLNDSTCLAGATNLVTYICTWIDAALVANGTGTTMVWMKKANGASAVSVANFIA